MIDQEPVFVPIRLPELQHIAGVLEVRYVSGFVAGISDHQHDVNDQLGGQARY